MLALLAAMVIAAPMADEPTFTALGSGVDGTAMAGTLERLSGENAELRTIAGQMRVANLVSLRRVGVPLPPFPVGPMLMGAGGDRIPGQVMGGDDRGIEFRPDLDGTRPVFNWKVPYPAVAALWNSTPPADTPLDPSRYAWVSPERNDTLRLLNGDTLRGTVETVGPDVRFQPAGDAAPRSVPLGTISAIAFNPGLARVRKPQGAYAHVVLANGARLAITGVAIESGHLVGKTLFAAPVRVALKHVVALEIRQGKAVSLSDLKPKGLDQADFLGLLTPPGLDRTANGEPLRLPTPDGDSTFDRGLATRPRTRLVYDLGGKYARFDATVGLDASTRAGSATIRVLVDGKDVLPPEQRSLTPGMTRLLRIPLRSAKELTLIVDFGPSGGVQADVHWADARLVE